MFNFRKYEAFSRAMDNDKSDLSYIVDICSLGDWFILMQLSKHFHPGIFREFIIDLRTTLKFKNGNTLKNIKQV